MDWPRVNKDQIPYKFDRLRRFSFSNFNNQYIIYIKYYQFRSDERSIFADERFQRIHQASDRYFCAIYSGIIAIVWWLTGGKMGAVKEFNRYSGVCLKGPAMLTDMRD